MESVLQNRKPSASRRRCDSLHGCHAMGLGQVNWDVANRDKVANRGKVKVKVNTVATAQWSVFRWLWCLPGPAALRLR